MRGSRLILMTTLLALLATTALAADPPGLINYQGVLRDALDAPLAGDHDMVFSFHDAETGGNEILLDRHTAGQSTAVTISGGLFNVSLGGGSVIDGTGPGTYDTLAAVFRDHGEVWMEIDVDGEALSPRVRVVAAPFSLNADHLDGRDSSSFLDTTATAQTKTGPLELDASTVAAYGIEATGQTGGGFFIDADGSGLAIVGNGDNGIHAAGTTMGGSFEEIDGSGYVRLAWEGVGVNAQGHSYGGLFQDTGQTGYVIAGWGDRGIYAQGNDYGGHFNDSNDSSEAYLARGSTGIEAYGSSEGAYLADTDGTGYARIGYGHLGVNASGNGAGGYFADGDDSGSAYIGYGDSGVHGYGQSAGGYFEDTNSTGTAWLGYGNAGISASGSAHGGHFTDSDGEGYAYVGTNNRGINAYGSDTAGYFEDTTLRSRVWVGNNDLGISSHGNRAGGYFKDKDGSSYAWAADTDYGINGFGPSAGGRFEDLDGTGVAYLGENNYGIRAVGGTLGGKFTDVDTGTYLWAGYDSSSTFGNGAKNFVQNHPHDKSKVVVFSAIEGDEVATYTRGAARLVNGEASVPLGEAFRLVTNPDIGLTAQVTPRGPGAALYVESVTTEELIVRAVDGFSVDVPFDYRVAGLRIGFEEKSVIREKDAEAYIPSMSDDVRRYEKNPDLRRHNALERFKAMRQRTGKTAEPDLTASDALRTAVGQFDPAIHVLEEESHAKPDAAGFEPGPGTGDAGAAGDRLHRSGTHDLEPPGVTVAMEVTEGRARTETPLPALTSTMPVAEPVGAGDLVVFDPEDPTLLSLSRVPGDPALFGVVIESMVNATGDREADGGEVDVAHAGIVSCNVDAGYGAIRPGDLLTTSPTPGHAMLAVNPLPGTVLGKAIEPLEAGAGTIRVIVTLR